MKLTKKMIYNIIFFGFIIFLFTPYGKTTKAKILQGVTYVKSMLISPSVSSVENRVEVSSFNAELKGIYNANNMNLSEVKGNVVFLNYWATWCPPCVAEMPSVQSLYDDYKDKIAFVFITQDDLNKVDSFYKKKDYNLPTYNLMSAIAQEISTRSLPTTFIIDKKGKVALRETGASNWNSGKVRKLLDGLLAE
jgi:thiol-disulfide isomerase/thioredoxin